MIDPPTIEEIRDAAARLAGPQAGCDEMRAGSARVAIHTPLIPLHAFEGRSEILLKPEIHQPVTSFKIRGVFNAVAALTDEERAAGLSTVSAGNTAQALAWTAQRFGVSARSIMPDTAPPTKIEAVRRYGGVPILVPVSEVFRFLKEHLWENEPYAFIHPWTNRNVMIGHGTIGLEIIDDLPDVETVFIPVGGGGLMGGVGTALKALKPSVRVVAVEPAGCPAFYESMKQGKPVAVECNTICDGVAVPYMTEEVFPLLRDIVDRVELVSEDAVKATIKRLALGNRMIVEGAGALSVAAALAMPEEERDKTVCIVTGGSIDTDKLIAVLTAR